MPSTTWHPCRRAAIAAADEPQHVGAAQGRRGFMRAAIRSRRGSSAQPPGSSIRGRRTGHIAPHHIAEHTRVGWLHLHTMPGHGTALRSTIRAQHAAHGIALHCRAAIHSALFGMACAERGMHSLPVAALRTPPTVRMWQGSAAPCSTAQHRTAQHSPRKAGHCSGRSRVKGPRGQLRCSMALEAAADWPPGGPRRRRRRW
jgi:hypothetical protein